MRLPTTMRGYISFFRNIETGMTHSYMKGFDELPKDLKKEIKIFDAELSNCFNEILEKYNEYLKTKKVTKAGKI